MEDKAWVHFKAKRKKIKPATELKSGQGELPVESYLILPIQRPCRYELLLREVVKQFTKASGGQVENNEDDYLNMLGASVNKTQEEQEAETAIEVPLIHIYTHLDIHCGWSGLIKATKVYSMLISLMYIYIPI